MQIVSESNQSNERILILADFSERNWEAIEFAMEHLYNKDSLVCIVQTWKKPNFGFSMVRDLSSILQGIAENELEDLKIKLVNKYALTESQILLYPFEGDLLEFFASALYRDKKWQVVMASAENGHVLSDNPRIIDIINSVEQPLYVLAGFEGGKAVSDVFVLPDAPQPSASILSVLEKISKQEKVLFRVCLDSTIQSRHSIDSTKTLISKACKQSQLLFLDSGNEGEYKEFRKFAKVKGRRVMVFDQNPQRKFRDGLKSCLDFWLIRSKGIYIGNY